MQKGDYIALRNTYRPARTRCVFVLESPPAHSGYVYDPNGRVSEVLFRAFMRLLDLNPDTKDEGLCALADAGWILVNAVYVPVNKLPDSEADRMIRENYRNLVRDLEGVMRGDKRTPVILVKANVVRLLEEPLQKDGFRVLNRGVMIPFPMHYHADAFQERTKKLLDGISL